MSVHHEHLTGFSTNTKVAESYNCIFSRDEDILSPSATSK